MTYLYLAYIFILGAALGSFINVLALRLPLGKSLMGRSHCDHCQRQLGVGELVPILSFIFLRGRCLSCRKPIPWSYFLVEVLTAIIFVAFASHFKLEFSFYHVLIFFTLFLIITLSLSDMVYQVLPDELLLLVLASGLLANYQNLVSYLGGALIVALIFWLIHHLSNGRAMGFADIKYVFVMGFWLPLPSLLLALYLAFVVGGVVSLFLVLTKKKTMKSVIAFGPFLSVGFLVALWLAN
jgi:leader peptidase (prepilin peptidase)/N-methyltransferase